MDMSQIVEFLQTTIGQAVLGAAQFIFELLFPSNAPGAPLD
ncbi:MULTISPECIES: hypothetical protein [unclassified Corynebacterium]